MENKLRVLLAHNFYQEPGGEDEVFAAEGRLLEANGHKVIRYTLHNDSIQNCSKFDLAKTLIWNTKAYHDLRKIIQRERPHIAHFHNVFPLISPSAFYASRAERVPVILTLHNYRLLCSNSLFYRDEAVCEDCLKSTFPVSGVIHGCYRESRVESAGVAAMLSIHRILGSWKKKVSIFIALTDFAKQKFIEGGLPEGKVVVKPNFVEPDPGIGREKVQDYALFVGRLSSEKGLSTLLGAWSELHDRIPLKIVGDGPLASQVRSASSALRGVEWLGRLQKEEVLLAMKQAMFLVFPSVWYEGLPMTIIEAFSVGCPVVGSAIGGVKDLIASGKTGFHFRAGDVEDLVKQVTWVLAHPTQVLEMRREARQEYETHYSSAGNYRNLINIYAQARSGEEGQVFS
ncbi:MAG TPA: glycosyltransferase family 4 protein [Nitrospirales bacterium]|nr:glycosyltransferase family 4 protein [Nitrospirales bacterium]